MLAIVPARRGSKGVPRKALRTVGGIPMILRTLRTVEASKTAERLIVSTDCPEIKSFCQLRGYEVLRRPDELGADDVPIMDVARHAVGEIGWTGTAGIFQPTCPLLEARTVRAVVEEYNRRQLDWAITVASDPHIHWGWNPLPHLLTPRAQRQELDVFCESGAVQLFNVGCDDPREGTIEIPPREALDIDTHDDLMLAERLCSLRNIHFVVLMGDRVGTGHFHRSLALAQALSHHNISWEWRGDPPPWAVERVPYPAESDGPVDVLIFDCLRPGVSEVLEARANGVKVVALEDESGDHVADLTVNDMLDPEHLEYAVLRSEFLSLPEHELRDEANRVLVTFGGTDPANLVERCLHILGDIDITTFGEQARSHFISGYGQPSGMDITLVTPGQDVRVAALMRGADVVLTSQGRTVLEAAAAGVPCISIAANERENRHARIPGVTYLGLHSTVTDDQIGHAVSCTLADRHLREENAQAAREAVDGRGLDRLVRRVEELVAE